MVVGLAALNSIGFPSGCPTARAYRRGRGTHIRACHGHTGIAFSLGHLVVVDQLPDRSAPSNDIFENLAIFFKLGRIALGVGASPASRRISASAPHLYEFGPIEEVDGTRYGGHACVGSPG